MKSGMINAMHKFFRRAAVLALSGAAIFTSGAQAEALSSGSNLGAYLSADSPLHVISEEIQSYLPADLNAKKQELLLASEQCAAERGNVVVPDSPIAADYADRTAAGDFDHAFISKNFHSVYADGFNGMIIQLTAEQVDEYIDARNECPSRAGVVNHAAFAVTNDRQYVYLIELTGGQHLLPDYESETPAFPAW